MTKNLYRALATVTAFTALAGCGGGGNYNLADSTNATASAVAVSLAAGGVAAGFAGGVVGATSFVLAVPAEGVVDDLRK